MSSSRLSSGWGVGCGGWLIDIVNVYVDVVVVVELLLMLMLMLMLLLLAFGVVVGIWRCC